MKKILIKSINNFNTALGENITLNIIEDDFKIKLTIKNKKNLPSGGFFYGVLFITFREVLTDGPDPSKPGYNG